MNVINSKLTVLFESPFWIGVYERHVDGLYEVCKFTFGTEPKDYEVLEYLDANWRNFVFSSGVISEVKRNTSMNPKRMQRLLSKQLKVTGVGTKAQEALKLQYEENKVTNRKQFRREKEEEKERIYQIKVDKRKKKHRGH